jgi:hypothetical protein
VREFIGLLLLFLLSGLVGSYARRFMTLRVALFAALVTLTAPYMVWLFAHREVEAHSALMFFAAFYLLRIWREKRLALVLVAAGVLACGGAYRWLITPHALLPQITNPLHFAVAGAEGTVVVGPLMLLAPTSLLALRFPEGRWTLTAFVVSLLPAAFTGDLNALAFACPYLALTLGVVFSATRWLITVVLAFHITVSSPPALDALADPAALCFRQWSGDSRP